MEFQNKMNKKQYRWVIWGILCLAYIVVFFHRLAAGVVKEDLMQSFGISATTFGTLGATYFYAYMVMQIPSGILADSLGARKTVTIGTFVAGVGSIIFGMATSIGLGFLGRLIVGLGVSVIFISILKVLSEWFEPDEFGKMSGITSFLGNTGGILAQTPLAILAAAITWRMSFIVIGVITLIISLLCYMLVRNKPEEIDSDRAVKKQDKRLGKTKHNIKKSLSIVIKNRYTWPGFFVFAGLFGAFASMTGAWGRSYLTDVYDMSIIKSANYMAIMVLGLAIGSVFIGQLSDRLKLKKKPMILFSAINMLGWSWIVLSKNPPLSIMPILLFVMGFTTSAFILGWGSSKEVNPIEITGIATSVVNMGGFFGAAILPTFIGMIFDKYGNQLVAVDLYQKAFTICLISSAIGFIATFFVKETHCKNIYKELQEERKIS